MIPIVFGGFRTVPEGLGKKTEGIGNQGKKRDHPDFCYVEIGLNNEKNPRHLGRLCSHSNSNERPSANAGV